MRSSDPPADLIDFPQTAWVAGHRAHRIYRQTDPLTGAERAPLFFSTGTGAAHEGRWDLPEPDGSCYLADHVAICVLEVLAPDLAPGGPRRRASETWLRQRRRVEVVATENVTGHADLDADAAFGYGVAGDLHTTDDRALTQRWAAELRRHGHTGIRAHARTPPAGSGGTWTLFGPAGAADAPPNPGLAADATPTLHDDAGLLRRLADHGVEFLPVPNDVDAA